MFTYYGGKHEEEEGNQYQNLIYVCTDVYY